MGRADLVARSKRSGLCAVAWSVVFDFIVLYDD